MKYLSEYIETAQSACFKKYGVFFAFSNDQFENQMKEDVQYTRMGMGMFCPKDNVTDFMLDHVAIVDAGMAQDVKDNTIEGVIKRELNNYEAYYTGDPTEAFEALKAYGVTEEQVTKVFKNKNYKLTTA